MTEEAKKRCGDCNEFTRDLSANPKVVLHSGRCAEGNDAVQDDLACPRIGKAPKRQQFVLSVKDS